MRGLTSVGGLQESHQAIQQRRLLLDWWERNPQALHVTHVYVANRAPSQLGAILLLRNGRHEGLLKEPSGERLERPKKHDSLAQAHQRLGGKADCRAYCSLPGEHDIALSGRQSLVA